MLKLKKLEIIVERGGDLIMTNYKTRITTAIATGSVLLQALAGITHASTIEISGNGAGSNNGVAVNQVSTTQVSQTNTANVSNNVNSSANTGGNDANFNTGGNVTVNTGAANVSANVSNNLNSNAASVNCCANNGGTNVEVSGNGAFSDNQVGVNQTHTTAVSQGNAANVNNNVNGKANTGYNDAGFNTGGDVTVSTGKASVHSDVSTQANTNWAHVGSDMPMVGTGNDVSLKIVGNGAGSENTIGATLANTTALTQSNEANVNNNVDAKANSGKNDANFNTGGDVVIHTGNAEITTDVDNAVNFNAADVDCGCAYDLTAKIAGNGAAAGYQSSDANTIAANLISAQSLGQGNGSNLNNNLNDEAKTGKNEASKNTGEANTDPSVVTGNASSHTSVDNTGNTNIIGSLPVLPNLPNFDFDFNWAGFWGFWGMSL